MYQIRYIENAVNSMKITVVFNGLNISCNEIHNSQRCNIKTKQCRPYYNTTQERKHFILIIQPVKI